MKTIKTKSISLYLVLIMVLALASCADKSEDSILPTPTPTPSHLVINSDKKVTEDPAAHSMIVKVSSNVDFKYVVKDGDDWITPESSEKTHAKGDSVKIVFNLQENKSGAARKTTLLFATADSKDFTDTIHVTQNSSSNLVINSGKKVTEILTAHQMIVKVSSNVDFKYAVKDGSNWITSANSTKTHAKGDNVEIAFNLEENASGADRQATLLFATADSKDFTDEVDVTQTGIINVKKPGTLSDELTKEGLQPLEVQKMTVEGTLNGADILFLRKMAGDGKTMEEETKGQLRDLTFSNVSFEKDPNNVYFTRPYQSHVDYYIDADSNVLPKYMFAYCSLESFTISSPNTIKVIGDRAFFAAKLKSVKLPQGVSEIGISAFSYTNLTKVDLPDKLVNIDESAFSECMQLTNITIPDGITSIGLYAFAQCSKLTNIKLPNDLKSIGQLAFAECSELTNLTIPDGVTSIGAYAFTQCYKLANIKLPSDLISIGTRAFDSCSSLEAITIPSLIQFIGDHAFAFCGKKLKSVQIDALVPTQVKLGANCFDNDKTAITTLYVPKEKLTDYQKSDFKTYFGTRIAEQK